MQIFHKLVRLVNAGQKHDRSYKTSYAMKLKSYLHFFYPGKSADRYLIYGKFKSEIGSTKQNNELPHLHIHFIQKFLSVWFLIAH